MPNWCSTAYVIEGDAKEVKSLYELMKGLQERKEPSVKNGFGTTWLGCLVDALGGDWNEVWCRGEWDTPLLDGEVLRLSTMTAWSPCNETFDFVCKKFPSLRYFYQSEEPGMVEYRTNDREGKYFPDKYIADVCTDDGEYLTEYFADMSGLFEWLEDLAERPVKSQQEVEVLVEEWRYLCQYQRVSDNRLSSNTTAYECRPRICHTGSGDFVSGRKGAANPFLTAGCFSSLF